MEDMLETLAWELFKESAYKFLNDEDYSMNGMWGGEGTFAQAHLFELRERCFAAAKIFVGEK